MKAPANVPSRLVYISLCSVRPFLSARVQVSPSGAPQGAREDPSQTTMQLNTPFKLPSDSVWCETAIMYLSI